MRRIEIGDISSKNFRVQRYIGEFIFKDLTLFFQKQLVFEVNPNPLICLFRIINHVNLRSKFYN